MRKSAQHNSIPRTALLSVSSSKQTGPSRRSVVAGILIAIGLIGCQSPKSTDGFEDYTFRTASVLEARWGSQSGWSDPWQRLEGAHSFTLVFNGDDEVLDALSDATLTVVQFDTHSVRHMLVEIPLVTSEVIQAGRAYHRIDAMLAVHPRWPELPCFLDIGGKRLVFRKRIGLISTGT